MTTPVDRRRPPRLNKRQQQAVEPRERMLRAATEIFAAAIQDYERGSIVGEHSYGKGTVQETFDLNQPAPAPGKLSEDACLGDRRRMPT